MQRNGKEVPRLCITPSTTLAEAKQYIFDNRAAGVECPCCSRLTKVYRRKLSANLAAFLADVATKYEGSAPEKRWFHINEDFNEFRKGCGGDYTYLRFFGLFEQYPKDDFSDKSSTGLWRITDKGLQFVRGEIDVPVAYFVLNNRAIGHTEETTSIEQALGDKFELAELFDDVTAELEAAVT